MAIFDAIFGAFGNAISQRREIRRQERIAEDRLEFDLKVYDWQNLVAQTQYEYDKMRVGALRAADAQAGADYARQQEMLIEQAVENYRINSGAIFDQFVVGERLRAKQDQIQFQAANQQANRNLVEQMRQQRTRQQANDINMQVAGDQNVFQQELLGLRATEIARESTYEAAQNGLQLSETVRQFLQQGRQIRNQADVRARGAERAVSEVMGSIAIEEATDNFGWQIQQVQAMLEDGVLESRASANQGGGATSRRLAIESAQRLGRTWGQQVIRSRARGLRVNLINELLSKELAGQSAGDVLALEDLVARAGFELTTRGLRNTNIQGAAREGLQGAEISSRQSASQFQRAMERGTLEFDDSQGAQRFALQAYRQDYRNRNRVMEKLTIPSYALARRQGKREAEALFLRTKSVFDQASIPYRGGVFFDPVAPIPGPGPEQSGTANFSSPGFGQILASNLAGAAGQEVASWLGDLFQGNLFPDTGGGGGWGGSGFNPASFNMDLGFGGFDTTNVPDYGSAFSNGGFSGFDPAAFKMDLGF